MAVEVDLCFLHESQHTNPRCRVSGESLTFFARPALDAARFLPAMICRDAMDVWLLCT